MKPMTLYLNNAAPPFQQPCGTGNDIHNIAFIQQSGAYPQHENLGHRHTQPRDAGPLVTQTTAATGHGPLPIPANSQPIPNPKISDWLHYLQDHCPSRAEEDIEFTSLEKDFIQQGFTCVNQLTANFVKVEELAGWLGISIGLVVSLVQYAHDTRGK